VTTFQRREVPHEVYLRILDDALAAAHESAVPFALIGGIASTALGRHRYGQDVDFFVEPGDARTLLEHLDRAGFAVQETNPKWLFKAIKEGVLVDVIFDAWGGIRFDGERQARVRDVDFEGRRVPVVGPEDLLIMKANLFEEHKPRHWFDALAVIKPDLDWPYLVRRSRPLARQVLALLLFGQQRGLPVPDSVIRELFDGVFAGTEARPSREGERERQLAAQVHERLAADIRVNQPELEVSVHHGRVVVTGVVATPERQQEVSQVLTEMFGPGVAENRTRVLAIREGGAAEKVS
jgi:predicted nucleotidyltransferase